MRSGRGVNGEAGVRFSGGEPERLVDTASFSARHGAIESGLTDEPPPIEVSENPNNLSRNTGIFVMLARKGERTRQTERLVRLDLRRHFKALPHAAKISIKFWRDRPATGLRLAVLTHP